jgi:hypothetical protein
VQVQGGQGVQAGSGNQQYNQYIQIENVHLPPAAIAVGRSHRLQTTRLAPVEPLSANAVPRTQEQLDKIINDRPLAWAYLLFAGALIVEMEALDARYKDYLIGYAPRLSVPVYESNFMEFYRAQFSELHRITQLFQRVFSNQAVDSAIDPQGTSGDPAKILHLAKRYISVYDELLNWTRRLRGTPVPLKYQYLTNIVSRYSEQPIAEIRRFVADYATQVGGIPNALASGTSVRHEHRVKWVVPPELSQELKDERARLENRA